MKIRGEAHILGQAGHCQMIKTQFSRIYIIVLVVKTKEGRHFNVGTGVRFFYQMISFMIHFIWAHGY